MTTLLSGRQAVSRCLLLWQKVPSPEAAARRGQASSQYPSPCPSPWETAARQIRLPEWPSTALSCSTAQRESRRGYPRRGYPCSPYPTAWLFPGALGRPSQGRCPSTTLLGRGAFRTRHAVLHATVPWCCCPANSPSSRASSPAAMCQAVPRAELLSHHPQGLGSGQGPALSPYRCQDLL